MEACSDMTDNRSVRVRPIDGKFIGTTAFFRNRAFLAALASEIRPVSGRPVRILAHACSIGAEAYSLAIELRLRRPDFAFEIDATDLSQNFVNFARRGVYPLDWLNGLRADERAFFESADAATMRVVPEIRQAVRFLDAQSFVDLTPERAYDVTLLCNALVYVDGATQSRTLYRIAGYTNDMLAVTAAHLDRIEADLDRNGLTPILTGFEAIHAGWTDRQRPPGMRPGASVSNLIFTDPYLDPIDSGPGWQYRHGALFRKRAAAAATTAAAMLSLAPSPTHPEGQWCG